MKHRSKSKWHVHFRDLFLGALALVILYDQVFIATAAQPILIFLVVFLLGSIPALRGDNQSGRPSVFARLIMNLLGVEYPSQWTDQDGTDSSDAGQTPSDGHAPEAAQRSSSQSPKPSTKDGPSSG